MDDRQSSHRERFVAVKEALHKAVLDRDIMEAEKAEIVDALSKVSFNVRLYYSCVSYVCGVHLL